ncbi:MULTISPECIES: colicin D domain-containing protein [unclassified Mesorhizobium]|uniref:colicin D domain-containing protein n=1 Tax=unclassified Mesorhizobium TaxID=325217 RepID=UPI003335A143
MTNREIRLSRGRVESVAIQGAYQGQSVTHFVDPQTGLNVIRDSSGNLLSGWKLSPKQLEYVLTTGKLGGGL